MLRLLNNLIAAAFLCSGVIAQQATPTPASTPAPQATPIFIRAGRGMNPINNPQVDGRVTVTPAEGLALRQLLVQKYAQPLYRKPTESELESIAPDLEIRRQYKDFLDKKNTGIFRLVDDAGCGENDKVVVATDACLKYTMPGSGNSFSFRTANYRIRHLADLMLSGENFRIPGIMMHGLMTKLGDVAIDRVLLTTPGVGFLTEMKPAFDFENAKAIETLIATGLERDGFVYGRSLDVQENVTYAMRVIAYDGKVNRAVPGAHYNEMDFDRRRDMIVAFRVVQKAADGSVTLIWAELSNTDAPKLKFPEGNSVLSPGKK